MASTFRTSTKTRVVLATTIAASTTEPHASHNGRRRARTRRAFVVTTDGSPSVEEDKGRDDERRQHRGRNDEHDEVVAASGTIRARKRISGIVHSAPSERREPASGATKRLPRAVLAIESTAELCRRARRRSA